MANRWGRVNDDGYIVEFTYINPEGRFHPDLLWVEVNEDTKINTRLVHFGSEEVLDPEGVVGFHDMDVLLKLALESEEQGRLEAADRAKNPINDFTINLLAD